MQYFKLWFQKKLKNSTIASYVNVQNASGIAKELPNWLADDEFGYSHIKQCYNSILPQTYIEW